MMEQKVAAIDVGTNTARLLIGRLDASGSIQPLQLKRHITRLGGGFSKKTGLSTEAKERAIAAMSDFAETLKQHGVTKVRAVATSAVRDALNGKDFSEEVSARTGICLEVIDGNEEAILTLRGVLAGLDKRSGDYFIFDVGGGSTEYTLTQGETPVFTRSLPLGVVRLTEGKITYDAMNDKISRELANLVGEIEKAGLKKSIANTVLVGTAGTATSLAAIHLKMEDYDYRRVNNYCLSINSIKEILTELLPMSFEERLTVPGLEKGREDLIIAGILITIKTMETFDFKQLKVSDYGLLEGLINSAQHYAEQQCLRK
jgi:exopolyphosphatase/guanosine-5'-triphosphate,3'-diphosphate pyrophosphatase